MEKTAKEMMKAYVDSQKFSSTTEIMDAMKEMFRDVLQQVMESELDAELGNEKSQRTSETAVANNRRNYRNGYSKKTVKTQLGEVEVKVPRDRNGEYQAFSDRLNKLAPAFQALAEYWLSVIGVNL